MVHDVFVSYSHHDKPEADAVCAILEANGIRCWIAPRDVVPGQEWGEAIVNAIQTCRVMVLVFSRHANQSPQIKREVERAVNAETIMIPFRIEDVAPTKSMAYFLGSPRWLDALTPPLEDHLKRLVTAVAGFLGESAPVTVDIEASARRSYSDTPATNRLRGRRVDPMSLAGRAVLLFGLCVVGGDLAV